MKKAKHTPGPWEVEGQFYGMGGDHYSIGSVASGDIAEGLAYVPIGNITRAKKKEMLANARLIAAAPELLEALERILNEESIVGRTISRETLGYAYAAKAKAKGE